MRIGIIHIDDLGVGPKVLHVQQPYYFNLLIRIRPFYIRLKIWWTRVQLAKDIHDAHAEQTIWTKATLEKGDVYGSRR
jgi:hypothetical protein